MSITLYDASVPVFRQMLVNLGAFLGKGAESATARGFDVGVLLEARLAPDMHPLRRQVQLACDAAKFGVARIGGIEPPRNPDTETTLDELRQRIAATIAFVDSVPRSAIEGSERRSVTVSLPGGAQQFEAMNYLLHFSMPNFMFHVTTAYAILRHNGVTLGKRDFLAQRR